MDTYYLFLDESKVYGKLQYFCLGGCIIEKNIYTNEIIPLVNKLKNTIFGSMDVILHESEIRRADNEPYDIFKKDFDKKKLFWDGIINIFNNCEFTTIGSGILSKNYEKVYKKSYANDEYFITLQIILENFVHFLENHNGKGAVYIESQNSNYDIKLSSQYHTILANGTLFINKTAFQKRLTTINFFIKRDNCVGLQIADFIPSVFNRKYSGSKVKRPSVINYIDNKLYDGNCNLKDRFGFKIIS